MKIGFYGLDLTIDEKGKPFLIELNGSNSGFDGPLVAYGDTQIQRAISAAFRKFAGNGPIYVVTRLVNTGKLPGGYLDKYIQDRLYFRSVENIHKMLPSGAAGATWARTQTGSVPLSLGVETSLDSLSRLHSEFKEVFLNVTDPSCVIPADSFAQEAEKGILKLRDKRGGWFPAIKINNQDILWLRCPSLAFAEPVASGIEVNPEFPYNAIAHNKLLSYEIFSSVFPDNVPLSLPMGDRCSGAKTLSQLLKQSDSRMFIRKPLTGSQANSVEIIGRQEIVEYVRRLERLENQGNVDSTDPTPGMNGIPEFIAAGVLSFDLSLLSELQPSRPVYSMLTKKLHHGCLRSLALVKEDNGQIEVEFLGGYWRLARVPVDGDGLLWERYVASQSQGAFCERLSSDDQMIVEKFTRDVLVSYYQKAASMPVSREDFKNWEQAYWLNRYRTQVPALQKDKTWQRFVKKVEKAKADNLELKQQAEKAGFLHNPSVLLSKEEIIAAKLPYLIKQSPRLADL